MTFPVRMTIGGLIDFLRDYHSGYIREYACKLIGELIHQYLEEFVYIDDYFRVYHIETASEMRDLITREGTPRRGSYNPYYIMWKMRKVHHTRPHELTGKMKESTTVQVFPDHVEFFIPDTATTRTKRTRGGRVHTYNFGPVHERKKSVLKATLVFAWPHIRAGVRDVYFAGMLDHMS